MERRGNSRRCLNRNSTALTFNAFVFREKVQKKNFKRRELRHLFFGDNEEDDPQFVLIAIRKYMSLNDLERLLFFIFSPGKCNCFYP